MNKDIQRLVSYEGELKPGDLLVWTEFPISTKEQFLSKLNEQPKLLMYFVLEIIKSEKVPRNDFIAILVGNNQQPVPYIKTWFHYPQVWIIPAP